MEIISHRGYWKHPSEKNTKESFHRSFSNGYGTETDLRDCNGDIVISHDMPLLSDSLITFDEFLEFFNSYNIDKTLALNVKSDGLQEAVQQKLEQHRIENFFLFDMSVPDTRGYLNGGLPFYSRMSEIEKDPIFPDKTNGIWLDAFESLWYDNLLIEDWIDLGKKVAIVSFELHKRDHIEHWKWIKSNNFHLCENLILCTDFPEDATMFFSK